MSGTLIPKEIRIKLQDWDKMCANVASKSPQEACGILLGKIRRDVYHSKSLIPTTNILRSQVRFQIDPEEQLAVFNRMSELGLDMVAIYHSHPYGPDTPSQTDIDEAYYPEAVQLIWSSLQGKWICRGFIIQEGKVEEIAIHLEPEAE